MRLGHLVSQAEAPAGVEADLIDVGFVDDIKKGGGSSGGFMAPLPGPERVLPMPSPGPPFSYPHPKGMVIN